jgi:fucose permease
MFHGWRVVGCAFAMAFTSWGFGFYGTSVYTAYLGERLDWDTSSVATAITAYYIVSAVVIAGSGDLYQRLGVRTAAVAGLLALGLGALGVARVSEPWHLVPALGALAIGWALTSSAGVNAMLQPWFQARRGLAISLALNGASLGGVIVVPVMVLAIGRLGFESGLDATAAMIAVPTVLVTLLLARSPVAADAAPDGDGGAAARARRLDKGRETSAGEIRSRAFLSVAVAFSLGLLVQVGVLVHLISYLRPTLGAEGAALCMTATTVAALLGRLATGAVVDRLDVRVVAALNFALQGLVLAAMALDGVGERSLLWCAVLGLTVGNMITLGPLTVGVLHDLTGGYTAPFLVCVGIQAVAASVILSGRSRRQ